MALPLCLFLSLSLKLFQSCLLLSSFAFPFFYGLSGLLGLTLLSLLFLDACFFFGLTPQLSLFGLTLLSLLFLDACLFFGLTPKLSFFGLFTLFLQFKGLLGAQFGSLGDWFAFNSLLHQRLL